MVCASCRSNQEGIINNYMENQKYRINGQVETLGSESSANGHDRLPANVRGHIDNDGYMGRNSNEAVPSFSDIGEKDISAESSSDSDDEEIEKIKKLSTVEFDIQNLGELMYFLEIEGIWKSRDNIWLLHQKYLLDMLKRFGMKGCKIMAILIGKNEKFSFNTR